jgi:hypothetical protein
MVFRDDLQQDSAMKPDSFSPIQESRSASPE